MQAVILAGGLGTRLRPLTYTTPKPLLPILNVPMVERLINTLPKDVDKVILAVSYMVDKLREHFNEHNLGREIVLVEEKEPLGTAGAIKNVEAHIDSTFFTVNGDVVCSLDFSEILDFHKKSAGIGTISMWEVEDPTRYGIIGCDSENRIKKFLEKPEPHEVFSNWINAGVYVLEPEILDLIIPDKVISIEREIFPPLASQQKLFGFKFYGYWVDAGTPAAYLEAHKTLLDEEKSTEKSDILENVKINKPVLIGKNCKISDDSELGPYSCLGDNVTVLEKTKISNTIVLGNSIIGRFNHLENAIVGYGCTIEDDVKFGEGVVIADNSVLKKGASIPDDSRIGGS